MRLGVFGGTFDPVHLGHLILAEQCREQARFDRVLFIPAARPPHKLERELTSFERRVEMLALALSGQPAFQIDELEKERAGPSFTVHTLEHLRRRHAEDELALIIGSDSLQDLPQWYEPRRILEMAELVVVPRPGAALMSDEEMRGRFHLRADFPLRVCVADVPLIEIASRDIRRRISEGRSIRYLVPRAVEAYIEDKGLYRSDRSS